MHYHTPEPVILRDREAVYMTCRLSHPGWVLMELWVGDRKLVQQTGRMDDPLGTSLSAQFVMDRLRGRGDEHPFNGSVD